MSYLPPNPAILPDGQEVKVHGSEAFPFAVYCGIIPTFIPAYPLHYHEEMELIYCETGSGSITIDKTDIRDISLESLRDNIAVVFQDNFLFAGTIRDNILLGKEDATEEEIATAVKMACLDEFINELENGLDTKIGERGSLLSGGQRQRLAIARAFIKNAPVVILDEATSALDNKAEAVVQRAIDNLMQDRTVFVIAHRLSTVQNADKIVVINDGEIIETGTHEELLQEENGAYKALYNAQFKAKKAA